MLSPLQVDPPVSRTLAFDVNEVISNTNDAVLLTESTAGQGARVGYRFEHLASIIELVEAKKRIGVCVDTCHMFAAGYDIRTRETFESTMSEFGKIVGFDNLRAMHLNDAKVEFESRRDRHDPLGEGTIGWDAFEFIMKDRRFDDIPLVLETPVADRWKDEVARLLKWAQ